MWGLGDSILHQDPRSLALHLLLKVMKKKLNFFLIFSCYEENIGMGAIL